MGKNILRKAEFHSFDKESIKRIVVDYYDLQGNPKEWEIACIADGFPTDNFVIVFRHITIPTKEEINIKAGIK